MAETHAIDAESKRLDVLHSCDVLDTQREDAYDRIVLEAAGCLGAAASAITLVAAKRCWIKASVGLPQQDTPRECSLCGYAFRSSGIFVVPDAAADSRFNQLPIVVDAGFRFYAGVPLITSDGHSLGTLCVLDRAPRTPTPTQLGTLRALAARVVALLESRRRGAGPDALAPDPGAAGGVVLIVDDDDMLRSMIAEMISRDGFDVRVAADGRQGLELFTTLQDRVRLIITDIQMPVMNGVELVQALRTEPNRPTIVAMSGKFTPEIIEELRALGVGQFLPKPFGMAAIKAAVRLTFAGAR